MAAAAAAAAGGEPSAPVLAPPAQSHPVPDDCKHKNRLQEYAQRMGKQLPIYHTVTEGRHHALQFRSIVQVDGEQFSSSRTFARRKEAEQDAARVALGVFMSRASDGSLAAAVLPLIDQDLVFCKSILHEYSIKVGIDRPSYSTCQSQAPFTMFFASVVLDGNTYRGEFATNKRDAEQKAARAAVKWILANSTSSSAMVEIVRSKERLITAINNKERGLVIQEGHSAPVNVASGPNEERGIVIQEGHSTPIHATNGRNEERSIVKDEEHSTPVNAIPPVMYTAYSATPSTLMYPHPQAQIPNEQGTQPSMLHQMGPAAAASYSSAGPSYGYIGQGEYTAVSVYPSASFVLGSSKKRKKNRKGGPRLKEARADAAEPTSQPSQI